MVRFTLYFIILIISFLTAEGQDISSGYYSYSCLSLSGISNSQSNFYCRSTIGQPNPTSTVSRDQFHVRQGFQQPVFGFFQFVPNPKRIIKLLLYPNPSSGIISLCLELEPKNDFQYRVVDSGGRFISTGYGKSGILMELDDLLQKPSGLYFLLISTKNGEYLSSQRVVVY
jgi:hypothetical protein